MLLCSQSYLHSRGMVHRDLKVRRERHALHRLFAVAQTGHCAVCGQPENILLSVQGAKVADFGLTTDASNTVGTVYCGTRYGKRTWARSSAADRGSVCSGDRTYMAPEVLRNQQNEKPADVWAFATMAYEVLEGKKPPRARQDIDAAPGRIAEKWPKVLRQCIDRTSAHFERTLYSPVLTARATV